MKRELAALLTSLVCMDCSEAREIVSARIDGEASLAEADAAATHVESCRACAAWSAALGDVNRRLRVHQVEATPDLVGASLARARRAPVTRPLVAPRVGLAMFAAAELLFAVFGGVSGVSPTSVHGTQHLGAFAAAVAGGLLMVAWRPARAFGVLPIVMALGVAIPVFAVMDWMNGELSVLGAAHHLAQVVALALVWVLAERPTLREFSTADRDAGVGSTSLRRGAGAR